MKKLVSQIRTSDPEFKTNAEHMRSLCKDLHDRIETNRVGAPHVHRSAAPLRSQNTTTPRESAMSVPSSLLSS